MDKVILLRKHLVSLKAISKEGGRYEKGVYIEGKEKNINFLGFHITVSLNDLKYYPQGAVNIGDKVLMTKTRLWKGNSVYINDEEWIIKSDIDYDYLADVKEYYLQRSNKDDSTDNGTP